MIRLFVAIDLPPPVKAALSVLAPELPIARWVAPEEIHLTLRFIGEVDEQSFSAIKTSLSVITSPPFPLTLSGVGHFPPRGRPSVLWVGMEPSERLLQLQREIELALTATGIPADERPFSPHITLARLKETPPAAVNKFEIRHGDLSFSPFEVGEFILYSSILTKQGAVHHAEEAYRCR